MFISEFLAALEKEVPLAAAGYARDAIGLQVGLAKATKLNAALFAYEVTRDIIAEAKQRKANLIIAFHPLIFPTIDGVTDETRTGTLIHELVKSDIALYILHTAFDTHAEFGTSRLMAEALKLENIRTLSENPLARLKTGFPDGTGMGALGSWSKAKSWREVLALTAKTFRTDTVRHNEKTPEKIKHVALLGGAGMEFYDDAVSVGADAFIYSRCSLP